MGTVCGGTSGLCNRQFFDNQFVMLVLLLLHTQLTDQLLLLLWINSGVWNRPETCTRRTSQFRHVGHHHLVSVYSMICN